MYCPTESERRSAAAVQALAGVLFFIPPLIRHLLRPFSLTPYLRYWNRVCLIWSLFAVVIIATVWVLGLILEFPSPVLVLFLVHLVFCIVGSLSAYFAAPFRYWLIGRAFCQEELEAVFG